MTKTILTSLTLMLAAAALASAQDNQDPNDYAAGEIIVKFSQKVADRIERKPPRGRWWRDEPELSDSLDELSAKFSTRGPQPLFRGFKKHTEKVKALQKKDKAALTKNQRHLLNRLKRAPKDANVPELDRIYRIRVEPEPGQSLDDVLAAYDSDPNVEYAELNFIVFAHLTPDDPHYPVQWPLNNTGQMYPESGYYNHPPGTPGADIDAPEAWDIYTGSSEIIVAVLDSGVDYAHRDLDENMWVNEAELSGTSGVDDDDNGYVDDIYGYDFCTYEGKAPDSDTYGNAGSDYLL
jgi:hypothetical protein